MRRNVILVCFMIIVLLSGCDLITKIFNKPPTASITSVGTKLPGESITLFANANDDNGDYLTYEWKVNNLPAYVYGDSMTFYPPTDGVFTVSVSVDDGESEVTDSYNLTINSPGTNQYNKTKELLGDWLFRYTIITQFTDYYYLDNLSYSTSSAKWYINGEGEYYNDVVASYNTSTSSYSLLDPGSIIDIYYVFNIVGDNITGTYYQIDVDTEDWSSGYSLSGYKTGNYVFSPIDNTRSIKEIKRAEQETFIKSDTVPPEYIILGYKELSEVKNLNKD